MAMNYPTNDGGGAAAAGGGATAVAMGANPYLAGAAIAAPILGGIAGNLFGSSDRDAANAAIQRAYNEAMSLGMPPDLAKAVVLQKFQSAGKLTPEMEAQINLGPSKVADITEDPTTRNAQVRALEMLQQSGRGLSPQDRAKFNQLRDETQRDSEAKRQQIVQSFAQRGMGGSGSELASQLQQAQASANQASTQGDQIAATSAENALNAIRQAGDLGGSIRTQDFNVADTKAKAADEFARFNTENQMAREARNVASRNQAQGTNLQNAQQVSNANTQQQNTESLRQNQAQRDYWDDQLKRTTLRANAAGGLATNLSNNANQTAATYSGIGSAVGSAAGAYNNYSAAKK